jgi:hypothetical protein
LAPHERGGHHGASGFSPGHEMQAVLAPHERGGHHGASSFSPGHEMQAASPKP